MYSWLHFWGKGRMRVQVIWAPHGADNPENQSRMTSKWGLCDISLGINLLPFGTHQIRLFSMLWSRTSHQSMFGETFGCRDASYMPNSPRMLAQTAPCQIGQKTKNFRGGFTFAPIVLCLDWAKMLPTQFPLLDCFFSNTFFPSPRIVLCSMPYMWIGNSTTLRSGLLKIFVLMNLYLNLIFFHIISTWDPGSIVPHLPTDPGQV